MKIHLAMTASRNPAWLSHKSSNRKRGGMGGGAFVSGGEEEGNGVGPDPGGRPQQGQGALKFPLQRD